MEVSDSGAKYAVGSRVICISTWDNAKHSAEVVDIRSKSGVTEYYVHYKDQNKRMDEWIAGSRIEGPDVPAATSLKTLMAERLAPLTIPGTPVSGGPVSTDSTPGTMDRKLTRNFKRRYDEFHNVQKSVEDLAPIDQTLEKEHEEKTKVKNIQVVELGKYEMDTWYFSPYPEEYGTEHKLYICEFCLKYMRKRMTIEQHKMKCSLKQPPGQEIYRMTVQAEDVNEDGNGLTLALFEVDGRLQKLYCQNLCLFAKLFLDHKTLYYDVEAFLFYVLTEIDDAGYHLMGYFSKEKVSLEDYNLACILTLPPYQRRGYGRLLITFAYELSKKEGKLGTPERPLSDLGKVSFRSYWTRILLNALKDQKGNVSVKDLSTMTSIRTEDIVQTLQPLNLIKYWKGQHIIACTMRVIEEHLKNVGPQPNWTVDPAKLNWKPTAYAIKRPR